MNAFIKTLFGDAYNLALVCIVVAITVSLVRAGLSRDAIFIMPVILLGGAGALALR